jgi:ABC-2 type transport system permease protein
VIVKRYLKLLAIYYRSGLLAEMEYRTNFVTNLAMSLVWGLWVLGSVTIFYYHRTTLGGWTYDQALLVVGLWEIFSGLQGAILAPNVTRMVEHIQEGTLDFVLLKPANSQFLATVTASSMLKFVDVGIGFVLITIGLARLNYWPGVYEILTFAVLILAGTVMVYSLWLLLITLAFWFVRVDNFTEIFSTFYEAGRFPIYVYRGSLRFVLTFIVPIAFLTTFPAATLLGQLSNVYVFGALGMATVLFYVSARFWRYAIRFYSSASS